MDMYEIFLLVAINAAIASCLYMALAYHIGQLRYDIRRFAKRMRSGRRQSRSEPDGSR